MTHEQFVTLETAKLAKQAGFDWECPTFYTETFDYIKQDGTGKFEFRRDDNLRYRNPNDDRNSFVNHKGTLLEYKVETLSAPTQSVLQRWLREVKNIWVSVTCDCAGDLRYSMYRAELYDEKTGYYYTSYWDDDEKEEYAEEYPTYEAALEAGLQECLTILIEKQ